jgi:hypothetical protein
MPQEPRLGGGMLDHGAVRGEVAAEHVDAFRQAIG